MFRSILSWLYTAFLFGAAASFIGCSATSHPPRGAPLCDALHFDEFPLPSGVSFDEFADSLGVPAPLLRSINGDLTYEEGSLIKVPFLAQLRPGWRGEHSRGVLGRGRNRTEINVVKNSERTQSQLLWPVPGAKIISPFGWRRKKFHDGLDITCGEGMGVFAAHHGKVVFAGSSLSGYGKLLIIEGQNLRTYYAHNKQMFVREGEEVEQGQLLALVGQTGNAEGPHLHFETRIWNRDTFIPVDPLFFFPMP